MATITGTSLDDVLHTTAAADTVSGGNGSDVILIGSGAHDAGERIVGGSGYDRIWFTSAIDDDTLTLLATVTQVEAVLLADAAGRLLGTANLNINAAAVLVGLDLIGNEGDNAITGTAKNDVLFGAGGADILNGGAGNDRIIVNVGEATLDSANAGLAAEGNTLVLTGTAAGDLVIDLLQAGDQLLFIDGGTETQVQSGFSHVDASRVRGGAVEVTGTERTNIIIGTTGNDTITGGAGNDSLSGQAGDDIFLIESGQHHGAAEVIGGGSHPVDGDGPTGEADIIRFTSLSASTTAAGRLVLSAAVTGIERIQISGADGDTSGTVALNVDARRVKNALTIDGNDGNNAVVGTAHDDLIIGNGGADTLSGGLGNDLYVVSSGLHTSFNDRIADSKGTEDFIVFTSQADDDELFIGAFVDGIDGVYLSEDPTDLSPDGTAALHVNASQADVGLKFFGNAGANRITGGRGHDTLEGGGGLDTLEGGLGSDVVIMDAAALDAADGGAASDGGGNTLRLVGTAAALLDIDLRIEGDIDQMAGDAPVQADFTHVDASEMEENGVRVTASVRLNKLTGSEQNDVFIYALPTHTTGDVIDGGDHEVDGDGKLVDGGDIIRFTSTTANHTLVLTAAMKGIETVQISDVDGDVDAHSDRVHIDASRVGNGLSIQGGAGQNSLIGTASEDTLNGNGGADTLNGGQASDTYEIDSLADYVPGDRINDAGGGDDRVLFTSTNDGDVLVLNAFVSGIEKIEVGEDAGNVGINGAALNFAARFIGNEGDNTLIGGSGSDTIEGGLGVDSIVGGGGADHIVVNMDDGGHGDINAGALNEQNVLVLKSKGDVFVGPIFIDLTASDQGLTLGGQQTGFRHVDGSGLTFADDPEFFELVLDVTGGNEANNFIGSAGDDRFRPGLGSDTVEGGGGSDEWLVASQAEYDGDIYTDAGGNNNDYIIFTSVKDGDTLKIRNNVFGVDAAACAGTADLNIDASQVDQPFGLQGNSGNNRLTATRHGESLFDEGGVDTMIGGLGDDDYTILGDGAWVFSEDGNNTNDDRIVDTGGIDHFYFVSGSSTTLVVGSGVSGIEIFGVTGGDIKPTGVFRRDVEVVSNAGLDAHHVKNAIHLGGNYGNNQLIATAFNDTIEGFRGIDVIKAGAGRDLITMDYTENETDEIDAGAIGEGNSLVIMGDGSEVLVIDLAANDQFVSVGGAADAREQKGILHVDASALTGTGVAIFGTSSANRITGTGEDDVLEGGAGRDTVVGGAGNDAFVLRNLTHQVTGERADGGAGEEDAIWFAWNNSGSRVFTLGPSQFVGFEVLMAANDQGETTGTDTVHLNASLFKTGMKIVGNDGANALTGTSKADVLIGNGGVDTLAGGSGNDVFVYEDATEGDLAERINGGAGVDVLRFTSTVPGALLQLGSFVTALEAVELGDAEGDITGTAAIGVDASAVGATVRLTMRGNEGNNTLAGGAGNDTFFGNGGNDVISGGGGADLIEMGAEADTLDDIDAGAVAEGNTLKMKGQAAGELVFDLTALDQLVSINGVDEGRTVSGITHLDLSQVTEAEATITGTAHANRLIGTALDDTFVVLAQSHVGANEVITGGEGSDRIVLTSTGDGMLVLTAKITGIEEVLVGTLLGDTSGTANIGVNAAAVRNGLKIEANDGNNAITGTAFADIIIAHAGADTILGGKGADKISTDITVEDAVNGGALSEGNEWVVAGTAAGTLTFNLAATGDQLAGGLVQSGFMHLDLSELAGASARVTGSAAANRIAGTAQQDTIDGGAGADVISMDVTNTDDVINAGAITEGNELRLTGTASATQLVDLSAAGDQVAGGLVQSGFSHLDASDMTSFGVEVTGSSGANRITGTAMEDTINAGAGADVITMDVTDSFDFINAGIGSEGDMLVLVGEPGGSLTIDLGVAAGTDQLTGAGDAQIQSGFQHVDASDLQGGFQLFLRGSNANNVLTGTAFQDRIMGRGGSDTIDLGVDPETGESDGEEDRVRYEALADGTKAAFTGVSHDRILNYDAGQDRIELGGEFNGGVADLDDIVDNNGFVWATDSKANFSLEDEAMFIGVATAKLGDAGLYANGLGTVASRINRVGVVAELGDDGLIVVQAKTMTGFYYYQEAGGAGVQGSELTLLGVIDTHALQGDFLLV